MNAIPLTAWIAGIGCLAPGLPDWPTTRAVLRGEARREETPTVLPAPALLPPAERRRASRVVRLALAVGLEAATHGEAELAGLATVFANSGADGDNCHALCEQLASEDRRISPTRFHNSVHNAAAGYWGIATRSMAPCQVICGHDGSFGASLVDALGQVVIDRQPTLLIAYDCDYPEPLRAKRPTPDCGGIALLLSPERTPHSLARLSVDRGQGEADRLADPGLEALRAGIPALRALPLLASLARGESATLTLDYLPAMPLRARIEPC